MISITLSSDDLSRLSPSTRSELAHLLGLPAPSPQDKHSVCSEWFAVPIAIIKKFMSGVSEQSKEVLKVLALHDGEIKWKELRGLTRYEEWQDLKGFQAGMNRRLRGLIDDSDAVFVSWDNTRTEYDNNGTPIDGYLKIHPDTAKSLQNYFAM